MKYLIYIFTVLCIMACTSYSGTIDEFITDPTQPEEELEEPEIPTTPPAEVILFFDDFNGDKVDNTKWSATEWGEVSWNYFMGHIPIDDFEVGEDNLYLRALWPEDKHHPLTMGLTTEGKFSFTYGEVQVRARFSKAGAGAWPAIWLMPQTKLYPAWPACGEIDIMERNNDDPVITHCVHWMKNDGGAIYKVTEVEAPVVDLEDYNTYAVRKSPGKLEFKVNGTVTAVFDRNEEANVDNWPFETDFYIIINQSCAGDESWNWLPWSPEFVKDRNDLPYEMMVDWVKVIEIE